VRAQKRTIGRAWPFGVSDNYETIGEDMSGNALKLALKLSTCALLLAACSERGLNPTGAGGGHGLDLAGMDTSVKPGDDFFAYVNGSWVKTAEIPADRSNWGVFAQLREMADKRTADLIQETANAKGAAGSESAKIGDFYSSYMDEAGVDAKGLTPLKPVLDHIAAIADKSALATTLGAEMRADVDALNNTNLHTDRLFGLWVAPDFSAPDRYAPYMLQGGLGLPDRDYYLNTDVKMVDIQTKYRAHIVTVLKLAGASDADVSARAERIYALEKKIAQVHASRADSEEVTKANNPWKVGDFSAKAPGLDWTSFFQAAGLSDQPMIMVWQPAAFKGIAKLVGSEPLDVWKDYLIFHAIDHELDVLPKAYRDERFAFYDQALTGAPKPRERWKQAVGATNASLGDAVGKIYAQKYFPPESKARAKVMVANIVTAFGKRIDNLDWMSAATKAKAKEKLGTLYVGIGYPDKWRDYSGLQVVRGDALGNKERSELFDYQVSLAKLAKPVDKTEWSMTPQTVNAVNLPLQNALNFPAAILEAPFFDASVDDVLNYGGIGTVIGHEISHSFDDQGALFDASGRLFNWWTPVDFAHFKADGARLAHEFDTYEPLPGLHVNGKQTLSENIADVAGIAAAYDGWRASLSGKPVPTIQGFPGDQAFYIRYGEVHRYKAREAALRRQVKTDGHAPDFYRADTVRNVDPWYAAFKVEQGQKLYLTPKDRVRVW
jgi:putative endopeptidase